MGPKEPAQLKSVYIHVAQDRDQWRIVANKEMILQVTLKVGSLTKGLLACQQGVCSTDLVQISYLLFDSYIL
jgi:hypothetical protein